MDTKYIIIDCDRHLVSTRLLDDRNHAIVLASALDASHVITVESSHAADFVSCLHDATSSEELSRLIAGSQSICITARSSRPHYPINLSRAAKSVWDEIVASDRFKAMIAGKDMNAQYSIAVRMLHAACKKRGIDAYTTGDAAGSPDASMKERLKRQLNLCKSYVEQIFRNLLNLHYAVSQRNWSSIVVVQSGSMYRIQATKRIQLKHGSSQAVDKVLRKYENFGRTPTMTHTVSPSAKVVMSVSNTDQLITVLGIAMSKAQLSQALEIDSTPGSLVNEANRRIRSILQEDLRSVVASAPSQDDIVGADEVVRALFRGITSKRIKMNKQRDGSYISMLTQRPTGHRPVYFRFVNVSTGTDEAIATHDRRSKYSQNELQISCDFSRYGLPNDLVPDLEKSQLFSAIKSAVADSIKVQQSYKRKANEDERPASSVSNEDAKSKFKLLVHEWTRHGNLDDLTLPFGQFCTNFVMFFKTRQESKFLETATSSQKKILADILKKEWLKHQPLTAGSTAKELRVLRTSKFTELNSEDKIQLPSETVLRPVKQNEDDEADIWQVVYPPSVFGKRIEMSQDDYMNCANIDNPVDSFSGSMDAAYEMVVENHSDLPTFTMENGSVGKLLGPSETWKFIDSHAWLHHLNMKVNHKSLTFEKVIKDGIEYLAVILNGDW